LLIEEAEMTRRGVWALLMSACLMARAASAQTALELYQRAIVQEQAAGSLPQGIELYRQAAKEAGSDRGLAAKALIRAAGSCEKLGQAAAGELYTEIMRTYPDQGDQVALAQSRLAVLRLSSSQGAPTVLVRSGRTDVSAVFDSFFEMNCIACHNQN